MAPQKLVSHATNIGLNVSSYPMKGTAFYVADRYDKIVKQGVTTKKIEIMGPERYILDNHLYDPSQGRWTGCPDLAQWHQTLEADFCVFFNDVAFGCGQAMAAGPLNRYWTAKYSTTVLSGHEAQRKPDLILIDQGTAADWRCCWAYAVFAVKSSIIFASQDNRNFVLAVGFAKYDMVVYRFDRGGLMRVASFSINGPTGWKYFARVAYSLAYGAFDLVGYDASCHTAPHFPPRYMALQAQTCDPSRRSPFPREYQIEMLLHVADNMLGRGSVVRRIRHISTGIAYIAKDTWHNVSRKLTEGQILRIISGIDNVPTICEEYVVGEDRYSSTAAARLGPLTKAQVTTALQNGEFQDRIHLRLLMEDTSVKLITQFKTRAGLAQALLDCVKAHRDAYERFGVLHRDIHIGNLYIKTDGANGTLGREIGGVLGDWGFAECRDIEKVFERLGSIRGGFPVPAPSKKGTAPPSPPPSLASSLTSLPSSPAPLLPPSRSGTHRMQAAGRDAPDYRETTTDVDSDWDTKRASKSTFARQKNPWAMFNPWPRDVNVESAERTGNAAFISVRLMLGLDQPGIEHRTRDDLESFFFVLLIIMVVFLRPGMQRPDAEFANLELDKMWWNPDQWASSAKWKLSSMKLNALWQENIADLFSDYFQCWTDSVEKLRQLIFRHYDSDQRLLSQMCMTDGVTYEDVIPVLQEMLQSGAEADAKDAAGCGQSSDASIQIDTDIASIASQHESFFSLAPADNAITTKEPHEIAFPSKSPDEKWYTPSEKFKITSVLTAVAATSEVPEGDVQPPSHHDLPHRDIISQRSRARAALTSTATDDLLTNVSTLTQGIVDNNDNDGISPVAVPPPSTVIPGPSHVVSNPKRKGSSTQDDTKLTKKSRTSERSKKTSRLAGPSKQNKTHSHGGTGNSRKTRSHPEDDGDYVPPGKQGKGKSRA
ncbi:hypothetical protein EV702DRAFT_1051080 [Suillus placidus]|uniref:Fungal-type protein kinase domain-containing protein n=1 Tax=Suillus placidus TaxID=48579 RepID=A0A9P6ZHG0_9AGAM|nr:hypothetical protein EV702DRAFT_1051080 [Suillus placidus]KAG2335731.1 hypothetical protein BDR05DRAFT_953862 [Suillus weaverae]